MSYLVLADALARAKERSGATAADDAYLTELLTLSAGKDSDGATHYRPFLVAARYLQQNLNAQRISKAKGGVEFTGLSKPIASLLEQQASIDKALGLTIPEGFEAVSPSCQTCSNLPRYRSRSLSTTTRP